MDARPQFAEVVEFVCSEALELAVRDAMERGVEITLWDGAKRRLTHVERVGERLNLYLEAWVGVDDPYKEDAHEQG